MSIQLPGGPGLGSGLNMDGTSPVDPIDDGSVVPWAASTRYVRGALALNPSGQLIRRKSSGVSGGTYDSSLWDIVGGSGGGTVDKAAVVATGVSVTDLGGKTSAQMDTAYAPQVSPVLTGTPTLPTTTLFGSDPVTEFIQDKVAAFLAAGSGISLTYDDAGNTLTIGNTGSGGGVTTGRNALTGQFSLSAYIAANGGDATGTTDCTAALQAAVNAASTAGGGTIRVDFGTYRVNGTVLWKSGVSLVGTHPSQTKFVGYQVDNAFIKAIESDGFSSAAPLQDCTFSGWQFDGSNQTLSGSYVSALKGLFVQHMRRVTFRDLWIHDTGATGVGCDFAYQDVVFDRCLVVNCGRLNPGTGPGGSGIGIGTASTTDEEPFTVTRCTVINAKRYGIFVESQNVGGSSLFAQSTRGGRISDNYVSGCTHGIGDAGNRNLLITDNQVSSCVNGITVNGGTFTQGRTGFDGEISNNNVYLCTSSAIFLDYSAVNTIAYTGHYSVRSNNLKENVGHGIQVFLRNVTVTGLSIVDNDICSTSKSGIYVTYSGSSPTASLTKSTIQDNRIYGNGTAATSGDKDAIRILVPIADVDIKGNRCFDDQATKTQGYGIVLSLAVTGGSIVDNDLRGNLTGAINFVSPPLGVHVANNPGYTPPAPQSVTLGASPATYTAPDYPTNLFLTGGTVSSVTLGGVTVAAASERVLPLEPGDVAVITYSAAPTATFRAR